MPYKRIGKVVYKIKDDGSLETVKAHKTIEEAKDHLVALKINVENKEGMRYKGK